MVEGGLPLAPSRAVDIVGTAIAVLAHKRPPQAFVTEVSPLIKQSLRLGRNVGRVTGATEVEEFTEKGLLTLNPKN